MRVEHIALYVNDLEGARAFFEKYLGATSNNLYHNPNTGFSSYFLSFEDGARLEIMNKPGLVDGTKAECMGYVHLAFSLGSKDAVDALTNQFSQDGYMVVSGPRTTGDGYYESCVQGFEGNLIELTI